MCGISGIVGDFFSTEQLEAMVYVQRHRGPDDFGIYINGDNTVGLGHNRLSIIDISSAGHQPMSSYDGRLWIVLNGEVYNYVELRAELSDYPFQSQSDTEVVLAAYERWGEKCVEYFIGMFAFAIWDERQKKLFCARDRLGIKPFYYVIDGRKFIFSSEIKALLSAGWPAKTNDRIIYDYLAYGMYEHTAETFFNGVYSLEPGHTLVWNGKQINIQTYWDLAYIIANQNEPNETPKDWCEELEALLTDSVRLRLRSDVPVGVHLSGGFDSSMLIAFLAELVNPRGIIEAFTAAYGDKSYDETEYAVEVVRSLKINMNFNKIDFDPAKFWEIAKYAQWHQEQPFGGVSTLSYWNMEKSAREKGIIVLLEGQGGDELFGGYTYYIADHASDLQSSGRHEELKSFVEKYSEIHGIKPDILWERIKKMQNASSMSYQDGSSYLRPECLTESFSSIGRGVAGFPTPSKSRFTNARFRDLRFTKLPRVLRFNDRMSMAFGCELRVPILDHRIVELSFKLPNTLLLEHGLPKWPLREIVKNRLPAEVRLAPKRAVVTPQREWFRSILRDEIKDRLGRSELVKRGYIKGDMAQNLFEEFCVNDSIDNSFFIWQWLNLDLWFEVFKPS